MARRPNKFKGSLAKLRHLVSETGVVGEWEKMPAGYIRFATQDGAYLNYWPTTGTVNVQGPEKAARQLRRALIATGVLPKSGKR